MMTILLGRQAALLLLVGYGVATLTQQLEPALDQQLGPALDQQLDPASLGLLYNEPDLTYPGAEDEDEEKKDLYNSDLALEDLINSDDVEPRLSDADQTWQGFDEPFAAFQDDADSVTEEEDSEQSYYDLGESERTFQNVEHSKFLDDPATHEKGAEKRRLCNQVFTGIDHYCNDPIGRSVWKTYWWLRKVRTCATYCKRAGREKGECREGRGKFYLTTWCKNGQVCFCQ